MHLTIGRATIEATPSHLFVTRGGSVEVFLRGDRTGHFWSFEKRSGGGSVEWWGMGLYCVVSKRTALSPV